MDTLTTGLLVAGLVLLGIEAAIPGFGVIGASGVICLTAAAYFILGAGMHAFELIAYFYLFLALVLGFFCWYLPKESKYNPFVLWERQKNDPAKQNELVVDGLAGKEGSSVTDLRPSGTAEIEGKRVDVITQGEYIEAGQKIRVLRTEGSKIVVERA